jgi:hypothetical protein
VARAFQRSIASTRARHLALALCSPLAFACSSTEADAGEPGSADAPNGFARTVFPVLQRAGCAECHRAGEVPSHWALTTPEQTYYYWVDQPGFDHCDATGGPISAPTPTWNRVVRGDPEASLVIKKLTDPWESCGPFHGHMPPAPRARLPNEDLEILRSWIAAGALP